MGSKKKLEGLACAAAAQAGVAAADIDRLERALTAVTARLGHLGWGRDRERLRIAVDELRAARRQADGSLRDAQEAVDRTLDAVDSHRSGAAEAPDLGGHPEAISGVDRDPPSPPRHR